MRLEELMSNWPSITLGAEADLKDIEKLYSRVLMKMGPISLKYQINSSFQKFLNYQGEKSFIFLMRNSNGALKGMAIFTIRYIWSEGRKLRSLYMSDLRVERGIEREPRLAWRALLTAILHQKNEIDEFKDIDLLYGIILAKNNKAIRALVTGFPEISWDKIFDYQALSIIGRKPLHWVNFGKTYGSYSFEKIQRENISELKDFYSKQFQTKTWGEYFNFDDPQNEWERRSKSWDDFDMTEFVVIKNCHGKIIAATLPWSPGKAKKMILDRCQKSLLFFLTLFPLIGKKKYGLKQAIDMLYFTFLEFDKSLDDRELQVVLGMLLDGLYKNNIIQNYHCVTICSPVKDLSLLKEKYILENTPALTFNIYAKSQKEDAPSFSTEIGGALVELALA